MYTVIEEDTELAISRSSADRLLNKIETTGRVCVDDVLSIECERGSIPKRIINSCSTAPSSHGVEELRRLLSNNVHDKDDPREEAAALVVRVMRGLIKDGAIETVLKRLNDAKDEVGVLYIPGLVREKLALTHTSLGDAPVQLLCGKSPVWDGVDISHIPWLCSGLRSSSAIGVTMLRYINSLANQNQYRPINGAYPGTLTQFLRELISLVGGIGDGFALVADEIKNIDEYEYRELVRPSDYDAFWAPVHALDDQYVLSLLGPEYMGK